MQKPQLLRAIYAELRTTLGPDVSVGDAVKLAHLILRSYQDDDNGADGFPKDYSTRSLPHRAVDEAMNDGGWRILEFEEKRLELAKTETSHEFCEIDLIVRKYLGPEWRHLRQMGQL